MNGADLAVLVVPFLDGSSNRVEAGTDLEDRSDPSNYRPISPTCKIMESIIKDAVITYSLENNLFINCQLGFASGRSVQLQPMSLLNHWTDILVSGHIIDVIYLDFKYAFDSAPHIRL